MVADSASILEPGLVLPLLTDAPAAWAAAAADLGAFAAHLDALAGEQV